MVFGISPFQEKKKLLTVIMGEKLISMSSSSVVEQLNEEVERGEAKV